MQTIGRLGICKGCNKERVIQNKTRWLCADCVYKLNHKGKSKTEVLVEKEKKKTTKSKTYVYKRKKTGERDLFLQIWNERDHVCENCGMKLGNTPKNFMFSHIKPKSIEPKMRLDKNNIRLLCWDCHYSLDFRGEKYYEERKGKFKG